MATATRRYVGRFKFQVALEALRGETSPGLIATAHPLRPNCADISKWWFLERGAALSERADKVSQRECRSADEMRSLASLGGKRDGH